MNVSETLSSDGTAVRRDAGPRVHFDADGLSALRAAVASRGVRLGMSGQSLGALMVVATELAVNVILHGGGSGRLRVWGDGFRVYCQVSDDGPGIAEPDTAGVQPVMATVDTGRGLWMARQFASELFIVSSVAGTTVTAIFLL
jgi:anti-sigma regulatory factor (Ser/Thr protein kinase)